MTGSVVPRGEHGPGTDPSHLAGFARGGSLNLVGAICNQLALFAIVALIAHQLNSEDVGRYALCYAILSILGLLSLCGFRSALTRFVAMYLADDDPAKVRGTVLLGMGLSIVGSAVLGALLIATAGPLASGVFHDPHLALGLRLTGLTLPAATFSDAALAATQGWRTQRPFTLIGRIYEPLTRLTLTAVALALGFGLPGAFWALVIGSWTAAGLSFVALARCLRKVPRRSPENVLRAIFSYSMVSWASTLASTGLIWADTLLLGHLSTTEQVGIYNVATRLVMLAVFVMAPINAAFAPHIAHQHHLGDLVRLRQTYATATGWVLKLSIPAFVVLVVFPHQLLHLFGKGFTGAAAVTVILACGQLVNATTGPCGTVLNMSGRVRLNMVDNACVLLLNVVLNLWLIPWIGIVGAAIAWSVSIVSVNVARVIQVRSIAGASPFGISSAKTFVAGGAGAVVGVVVHLAIHPLIPQLVVGALGVAAAFVIATLALGLSPSDKVVVDSVRRQLVRHRQPVEVASR